MDALMRGMMADRSVKFIAVSGRDMVEKARHTHALSRVCTAALGRALLAASMMGTMLKNDSDKLTIIISGGGPSGNIVCVSNHRAVVKGYIVNPSVELPPTQGGKLDVGGAVGSSGKLTVVRDYSMKEPYVGTCDLVSGEIAEDLAQYFTLSEQKPSLVYLGVRIDPQAGGVRTAGGMIIQPMPDCACSIIDTLMTRAGKIGALAEMLDDGESLQAAVHALMGDLELETLETMKPELLCDCNRKRLEGVLITLGPRELSDMIEKEGGAELVCHFCNTRYLFSGDDLKRLIEQSATK